MEQVSIDEYITWFNRLPEAFKKPVIAQWGQPRDCAIMTRDGNCLSHGQAGQCGAAAGTGPGWTDDPMKLYHDTTLYPIISTSPPISG